MPDSTSTPESTPEKTETASAATPVKVMVSTPAPAEPETKSDTKSDPKPELVTTPEPPAEPEPKAEPKPTAEPEPEAKPLPEASVPSPSATVQPFESAGAPPADKPPVPEHHDRRGLIVALVVGLLLVLAAGAAGYVYLSGNLRTAGTSNSASKSGTSSTKIDTAGLDAGLSTVKSAVDDATANLNDADTTLTDKQGDLAE